MKYEESSINDLYSSSVRAFPRTTKRQHAIDPIEISDVRIVPFMGMKTVLITANAQNESRAYRPLILFKNINFHKEESENLIKIVSEGRTYLFEPPRTESTDVLLRCQCGDWKWRFHYTDHIDHSLYGSNRKPYEAKWNPGSANPLELPGMCKHLMKLSSVLHESGLIL